MTTRRLHREIKNHHAGLVNALSTRKDHPTYGVTKADLRERLAHLEGLLYAFACVWDEDTSVLLADEAHETGENTFGFDLNVLRVQIDDA